jgi:hypothetical protein
VIGSGKVPSAGANLFPDPLFGPFVKLMRVARTLRASDATHEIGQQRGVHTMATDQVSFYDETLKKQIEGSFKTDGKSIHVFSAYGNKSFPYNDLGAIIDYNAQVLSV